MKSLTTPEDHLEEGSEKVLQSDIRSHELLLGIGPTREMIDWMRKFPS